MPGPALAPSPSVTHAARPHNDPSKPRVPRSQGASERGSPLHVRAQPARTARTPGPPEVQLNPSAWDALGCLTELLTDTRSKDL